MGTRGALGPQGAPRSPRSPGLPRVQSVEKRIWILFSGSDPGRGRLKLMHVGGPRVVGGLPATPTSPHTVLQSDANVNVSILDACVGSSPDKSSNSSLNASLIDLDF